MICLLVLSLLIAVAGGGMAQTPDFYFHLARISPEYAPADRIDEDCH